MELGRELFDLWGWECESKHLSRKNITPDVKSNWSMIFCCSSACWAYFPICCLKITGQAAVSWQQVYRQWPAMRRPMWFFEVVLLTCAWIKVIVLQRMGQERKLLCCIEQNNKGSLNLWAMLNAKENLKILLEASGSQSGRYRPPGVNWTIQGVDK